MSVRYFYHLTRDEDSGRYLINLVITTAFLEQGILDPDNEEDALLLAAMALGRHDTPTNNPLNTRTLNTFYDVFDLHLQEGAINRPYYATL